jgi:hypothetical protein
MGTTYGSTANGDGQPKAKTNASFKPTDNGRAMDKRLDAHMGCVYLIFSLAGDSWLIPQADMSLVDHGV